MSRRLAVLLAFTLVLGALAPGATDARETSLRLQGEPGDLIVRDRTLFFTDADGSFSARRNFDNGVSIGFTTPIFSPTWNVDFAAPNDARLTVGNYEGAIRWPFQAPGEPGLDLSGEGLGCNTLTGRFEVKEIVYGSDDTIISFWALFEQHCEGISQAAFGEIRYNANVTVSVAAPPRRDAPRGESLTFDVTAASPGGGVALTAENLPPGAQFADHGDSTGTFTWTPGLDQIGRYLVTFRGENELGVDHTTTVVFVKGSTSLQMHGEPGSIAGPQRRIFADADGIFSASRNFKNGVFVRFHTPASEPIDRFEPFEHFFLLDFAAADGAALTVGTFENAEHFQTSGHPSFDFSGDFLNCQTATGRFEVRELTLGPSDAIDTFWAVLEQRENNCAPGTGATVTSFAEIRFNADAVDLTVTRAGSGQGTVTSATPGIACGDDCQEGYRRPDAAPVALSAVAAPGSRFTGWSGACAGTGACVVTMDQDRAVTATFETIPSYTLTIGKGGTGTGRVTSDAPGIDCGLSCSARYLEGTTVTLTATPDAGFSFTGWSGACTGMSTCTLQMMGDRAVSATFARVADLRVSALSAPATVRTGQKLDVASTVINGGTLAAGAFTVSFYLSATDATPGAGVVIGTRTLTSLAAGASSPATTSITIPLGFAPGSYFLSAVADSGSTVTELDETNNGRTAVAQVTVLMFRADLSVTALSAPATVKTGQTLAVASTVKNTGQAAAPAFRVTFYLSPTDSTPGAGMAVGSRMVGGLGAAASSMATSPVMIPLGLDPGAYFLSAVVDDPNAIIEVDDANNGMTAAGQVTVLMFRADLTMTALAAPATGRTGQTLAVQSTVKNAGQAAAPAFRVTFYLSPSGGIPGAGTAVGSRMVGGLAAGAMSMATTPVTIPLGLAPGAYFLSAVADDTNAVIEVDETNNGLTATSQVTVLMFRADLVMTGVTAASSVRTGQTLSVLNTVKNVGQTAAPAFRVTFYLSAADPTPGAGLPVGSRMIGGLGVNASATAFAPVAVPLGLAPGAYFLSAVADDNNAVIEVDETNNGLTAAAVVTVVMFRADLTVSALGAPATGRTGQPLAVTHTVRNVGQTAAPAFRVTFYLSASDSAPGAGLAVGARKVGGLGAGQNSSATTTVMVPAALDPGTYFLSAVVDDNGAVIEVDETNNGLTSAATVTILMHRPDLAVTAITSPANGQTSRTLAVAHTVKNLGQAPAPAFRVTFYLSALDATPGAGLAVGSRMVGGLAAGGVATVTTPVTIPATGLDAGTYFLSAVATPLTPTPEVETANNGLTSSTPVAVELYRADLSITSLTMPSSEAVAGRPLAVTAVVKNTGPSPASAFRVSFYLSTNGTLDIADTLLGSQSVGGLAANASFTTTVRPLIPAALAPNQYFVIAVVDDLEKVTELVETNNVRAFPSPTAVVPLMVRTYPVMLTLSLAACSDPSFDGADTGPVTLRIPTQNGASFSGTFGFSGSVEGITVTTTFAFSGNVDITGAFDGAFTILTAGGGVVLIQGEGSLTGSITGTMLSAQLDGVISIPITGDTCLISATIAPLP